MVKLIMTFVNGLVFGVTQIVPGVSGGTLAIIMGFYDELIYTISNFTKDLKRSFRFIIPFMLGIGMGVILFSSLVSFLLYNFSLPTMLFFIGLIAGIAPAIFGKVKPEGERLHIREIILIVVPIIFLVVISHLSSPADVNPSEAVSNAGIPYMAFLFLAGAIAAAGLIIPGVSGSFFLVLMGVYYVAIYALSLMGDFLRDMTNTALMFDIMRVVLPLGFGVIFGGIVMAKLIGKLLEKHQKAIYSIILGLIIGSVYSLSEEFIVRQGGFTPLLVITGILACAVGLVLSFKLGNKKM